MSSAGSSAPIHRRQGTIQALPGLRPGLAWLESHCPDAVMVERGLLLRQGEPLLRGVVRHFHPPAILSAPFEPEDPEPAEVTEQMDRVGRVRQQAGETVGALSARPNIGELVIDEA